MSLSNEVRNVTKALSGDGVDEKILISILGKWQPDRRLFLRKETPKFFIKDERYFQRWVEGSVKLLEKEFMRFKKAIVLWTTHECERDAHLVKKAITKGEHSLLIEVACTRSPDELMGARMAYHSLFDRSMEEEAAECIEGSESRLLVALVSAYRFKGEMVKDKVVKFDVTAISNAIQSADKKGLLEDDGVLRVLTTRSKPHLKAVCEQYKKLTGKNLDEDLKAYLRLEETVHCLCAPPKYFTKVLDAAFKPNANKKEKKALTRVMVTRADHDMKQIKEEFQNKYGVSLSKKIDEIALGNYKDFLLTLDARGN